MSRPLLLCLLSLLPLGAVSAGKYYRWVDERGVAHFSDRPPAHGRFEEVVTEEKAQAAKEEAPAAPTAADAAPPAEPRLDAEAARRINCDNARQVLADLEANETVRMDLDGDGRLETLSAARRREQIALWQGKVAEYCGG
ncbi:MAG: DUF4124 domain-containing protein [Xanthomonadales bacterium]|nr:DUF4124 domain-containing protein [Xanthomonadales bacterium]